MTVAELSDRMSNRELVEWMEFARLEPFGDERADLRMGIETSSLVRMWADPKKSKQITPATFMPFLERAPQPQKSPQELAAAFDRLMSKHQ